MKLDGQDLRTPDGPLYFRRVGEIWTRSEPSKDVRKRPGLTGPVDDAFMESFVFVRPTGKPLNPLVGAWVESELTAARALWRQIFRGDAPIKDDKSITPDDIRDRNLILWGDPSSNALIKKIVAQLPVTCDPKTLTFRGKNYDAGKHALILVFPNPLNPEHYVVLNSGIDFRSDGVASNALQTPKLPDWSIVDFHVPADHRWPGKIVSAGFFDEDWK